MIRVDCPGHEVSYRSGALSPGFHQLQYQTGDGRKQPTSGNTYEDHEQAMQVV